MAIYTVVVYEKARNGSWNVSTLFAFEASSDTEAVAITKTPAFKERCRSGGVNWYPAISLMQGGRKVELDKSR